MPIPFDDPEDQNTQTCVVSWLRFVEDANGTGVDAALFQTSEEGQPVDFCFTRAALRQFGRHGNDAKGRAVSHLFRKLLPGVASSPMLVLGLADEIPAWVLNESLRVRIPFCLIPASPDSTEAYSDHSDADSSPVLWQGPRPPAGSEAQRLFDEVMSWDDLLEPFCRAAKALAEAFADEHVTALTSVSGLSTVVTLHSMAGGEGIQGNQLRPLLPVCPKQANPALDRAVGPWRSGSGPFSAPRLRVCAKCNWSGAAS